MQHRWARRMVPACGLASLLLVLPVLGLALVQAAHRSAGEAAAAYASGQPGADGLDAAVCAVAAAGGAACVAYLLVCLLLGVLAAMPGALGAAADDACARISPALVRRLTASVVGAALAAAPAGPAFAHERPIDSSNPTSLALVLPDRPSASLLAAAPVLRHDRVVQGKDSPFPALAPAHVDRPAAPAGGPPNATPAAAPRTSTPGVDVHTAARDVPDRTPSYAVVVHRGDTLWSIAARHLGAGASDAEVAGEWPRWWRANAGVIGPDPDHVRPGQVLRPPGN